MFLILDNHVELSRIWNMKNPEAARPAPPELLRLAAQLRVARKKQKVAGATAAAAAGISRVTLHRIESGEPGVAMGHWAALARALGLQLSLGATSAAEQPPENIRLDDYPQLKALAWHLRGDQEITPLQALQLYERNWRHIDREQLTLKEVRLIDMLGRTLAGGTLHV